MPGKTAFLLNPSERWTPLMPAIQDQIGRFSSAQEAFRVLKTEPDSLETQVADIVGRGFDRIVVGGGDGTLNRVVNALHNLKALDKLTLGLLPLGSCNDFAKAIGLKRGDWALALATVGKNRVRPISVARVNGHCFINNAGFGRRHPAAHHKGVVADLKSFEAVPVKMSWDGQSAEGEYLMMVCANGPYFSDGLHFSKDSDPGDDRLDFFFVRNVPKPRLFFRLALGRLGRPLVGSGRDDGLAVRIRAKALELESPSPLWIMTDGEAPRELAEIHKARFEIAGQCRFITA